jgi:hypothetical protein
VLWDPFSLAMLGGLERTFDGAREGGASSAMTLADFVRDSMRRLPSALVSSIKAIRHTAPRPTRGCDHWYSSAVERNDLALIPAGRRYGGLSKISDDPTAGFGPVDLRVMVDDTEPNSAALQLALALNGHNLIRERGKKADAGAPPAISLMGSGDRRVRDTFRTAPEKTLIMHLNVKANDIRRDLEYSTAPRTLSASA